MCSEIQPGCTDQSCQYYYHKEYQWQRQHHLAYIDGTAGVKVMKAHDRDHNGKTRNGCRVNAYLCNNINDKAYEKRNGGAKRKTGNQIW